MKFNNPRYQEKIIIATGTKVAVSPLSVYVNPSVYFIFHFFTLRFP